MDYSQRSEDTLAQITDFIGTWDADLSAFGEAYSDVSLYFIVDETGHGMTYMNGVNTSEFDVYAYESEAGKGIYVAFEISDGEAEGADYTLQQNEQGRTVLTLYAADGTISYVKRGD